MKYRVVVVPSAEREISESAAFYEEQKEGLGVDFLNELDLSKDKLSQQPHNYSYISKEKTLRCLSISRFPFKIIYEVHDDRVVIYSVYHDKRKPL